MPEATASIYIVKGEWTRETVEAILGEPTWEWAVDPPGKPGARRCGLSNVATETAGWSDMSACCRIHIHPEGLCITGGWATPADSQYAKQIADHLANSKEQAMAESPKPRR